MVGYSGLIKDKACSNTMRDVLFLFDSLGTKICARVPNTRIIFKFTDEELNIQNLYARREVEVEAGQIEAGKEKENIISLIKKG